MRQLAVFPRAEPARTLADYLLTQKIDTEVKQQPDGWAIWVRDEDHVPRARQEFEEFSRNPTDPRYTSATSVAGGLRQQKRQEDETYHRQQNRFNRRMSGSITSEPWTLTLVVACVLVSLLSDGGHSTRLVQELSISPYHFTEDGFIRWPELRPIREGQIWRLVTPIFLHFGLMHLIFNMLMLLDLGRAVERRRGTWRYLTLVLVLAVVSNLVQYYLGNPERKGSGIDWVPSPNFGGMSGVIYGLFGYVWMKARFQPELGFRIQPSTVTYLIAWFFLCLMGLFGPIANGAHAGGLLAGMLIGYVPSLWTEHRSS